MNMTKVKIYLDDVRTPIDKDWIVVRNYDEFVESITFHGLGSIDCISLDHDLGDSAMNEYYTNVSPNFSLNYDNISEKTGYDCAKWLVELSAETNTPLPLVYTHSANSVGYVNIMTYINNYLRHCGLPETCERVRIPHSIQEKE